MKLFEFGVFQKIHMPSRGKYTCISHMLFEAFHNNPRNDSKMISVECWYYQLGTVSTRCDLIYTYLIKMLGPT